MQKKIGAPFPSVPGRPGKRVFGGAKISSRQKNGVLEGSKRGRGFPREKAGSSLIVGGKGRTRIPQEGRTTSKKGSDSYFPAKTSQRRKGRIGLKGKESKSRPGMRAHYPSYRCFLTPRKGRRGCLKGKRILSVRSGSGKGLLQPAPEEAKS